MLHFPYMFEKGHKHHKATDGTIPGLSKAQSRFKRALSDVVQKGVAAEALRDFQIAIVMGFDPVWAETKDGTLYVIRRKGIEPTLNQRVTALAWLSDRGYGSAVPANVLEASKAQAVLSDPTAVTNLAALSPEQLNAAREALRLYVGDATVSDGDNGDDGNDGDNEPTYVAGVLIDGSVIDVGGPVR